MISFQLRDIGKCGPGVEWNPQFGGHARNAFFSSVAQLVAPLLMLIAMPIYLQQLGADVFGVWMLVNGVIGFGNVLNFGLTEATIKYVSKYRTLGHNDGVVRIVRASFALYLSLACLGALVIMVGAEPIAHMLLKNDMGAFSLTVVAIRIAAVGLVVRFVSSIADSVFYGFEKYDWASQLNIATDLVSISGNIAIAFWVPNLCFLIGAIIVVTCASTISKLVIIKRHLVPSLIWLPACSFATFREIVDYGFYSWIHSVIGLVGANLDRILIARFAGVASVGCYALCLQLTRQVHSLLARGSAFLFPYISTLYERHEKVRLMRTFNFATLILACLSTMAITPLYAFAPLLLNLWIGSAMSAQAVPIISILCFRYLLLPTDIANYYFMLGVGMVRAQAVIGVLTASTVTLGMIILTPLWGAIGTAWALLWSLPFLLFTRQYVLRKAFGIRGFWRQSLILLIPIVGFSHAPWLRMISLNWSVSWMQLGGLFLSSALFAGVCAVGVAVMFHRVHWMPSDMLPVHT